MERTWTWERLTEQEAQAVLQRAGVNPESQTWDNAAINTAQAALERAVFAKRTRLLREGK